MTKEEKQQFTLRISQANATEMVVILYDMALQYIKDGKEAFEREDTVAYKEAIRKVRGCINELIRSLNMEYEPAPKLLRLSLFCVRRLTYAEVRNAGETLEEVESILGKLRDAYAEIASANTAAPVMSNTQTVYSGLTYGKSADLTEGVTGSDGNRGMLV